MDWKSKINAEESNGSKRSNGSTRSKGSKGDCLSET